MLGNIKLQNILFLDIETVPSMHIFDLAPVEMQQLWERKSTDLLRRKSIEIQLKRKPLCLFTGKRAFMQSLGKSFVSPADT